MIISTANIAEVAAAVVQLLKDHPDLQDIGLCVELAEPVNEDPSKCPWIGVYPQRIAFPPRTLGLGGGYRAQNTELVLVCQETHPNSGEECLGLLGRLVKAATGALLTDTSLKGTVMTLADNFEVDFLGTLKFNDAILQTATLRATGLTTVSGG